MLLGYLITLDYGSGRRSYSSSGTWPGRRRRPYYFELPRSWEDARFVHISYALIAELRYFEEVIPYTPLFDFFYESNRAILHNTLFVDKKRDRVIEVHSTLQHPISLSAYCIFPRERYFRAHSDLGFSTKAKTDFTTADRFFDITREKSSSASSRRSSIREGREQTRRVVQPTTESNNREAWK